MANTTWILLGVLSLLWSSSFIFGEVMLNAGVDAYTVVFLRLCSAMLVFLLYAMIKRINMMLSPKDWGRLTVAGFLQAAFPFIMIILAQRDISGGLAAILNSTTVVSSLLLGALFLKEKLTSNRLIGGILGVLGVITAMGWHNIIAGSDEIIPSLYVIMATISYGFAMVWSKTQLQHLSNEVTAGGMLIASTIMVTTCVFWQFGEIPAIVWRYDVLLNGIAFGFFSSFLAFLIFYKIMATTQGSNATLVTVMVVPIVIIVEILFLNQSLMINHIIGCAMVIIGLSILDGRILRLLSR